MELENKTDPITAQAPVTPIEEKPKDVTLPSEQDAATEPKPEPKPQETANFDISAFEQEYSETGTLSEASYKSLESKGIPKHVVDNYIAGQAAKVAADTAEYLSIAGGADEYGKIQAWAAASLTQDEITTFNGILQSRDKGAIKLAMTGLTAKYKSAVGTERKAVTDTDSGSTVTGYESMAQMVRDVKHPLYKSDPAFRAKVERKAAVSRW